MDNLEELKNTQRVFGPKAVRALLQENKQRVFKLIISKKIWSGTGDELSSLASSKNIQISWEEPAVLDRIAGTKTHQGVMAFCEPMPILTVAELVKEAKTRAVQFFLMIFLDEIADVSDMEELLHLAEAAGAQGIIRPKSRSEERTRPSTDLLIADTEDLPKTLEELRKKYKLWVIGCSGDAPNSCFDIEMDASLAFVFAGVGQQLPPEIKGRCDMLVHLPFVGSTSRLSLSQYFSPVLFELMRQRLVWSSGGKVKDSIWSTEPQAKGWAK